MAGSRAPRVPGSPRRRAEEIQTPAATSVSTGSPPICMKQKVPGNGQPPGCSAALAGKPGDLHAARLDKCRRPGGRVTVRFSLAAVRRTGDHAVVRINSELAAHLDGG